MKLRTGRHNDRIVYLQRGDEPSDADPMVAVFFHGDSAETIVARINYEYEGTHTMWDELAEFRG